MMRSIKNYVKENLPRPYRYLKHIYHGIRGLLEKCIFGTALQEWIWKTRHLYKGKHWVMENWESRAYPPRMKPLREFITRHIAYYSPLSSIMEVGCGTGPQLYLLAHQFPDATIYGLDINREAIAFGKVQFAKEYIQNVRLQVGKADDLDQYPPKSFDVLFTNAVIFYIGPDKIRKIIKKMIRVTKKTLLLFELHIPHTEQDPFGLGIYHEGHWWRNYEDLLVACGIPRNNITCAKIPSSLWNITEGEFTYLIEVKLENIT